MLIMFSSSPASTSPTSPHLKVYEYYNKQYKNDDTVIRKDHFVKSFLLFF